MTSCHFHCLQNDIMLFYISCLHSFNYVTSPHTVSLTYVWIKNVCSVSPKTPTRVFFHPPPKKNSEKIRFHPQISGCTPNFYKTVYTVFMLGTLSSNPIISPVVGYTEIMLYGVEKHHISSKNRLSLSFKCPPFKKVFKFALLIP